jgi:hypothetical protein
MLPDAARYVLVQRQQCSYNASGAIAKGLGRFANYECPLILIDIYRMPQQPWNRAVPHVTHLQPCRMHACMHPASRWEWKQPSAHMRVISASTAWMYSSTDT